MMSRRPRERWILLSNCQTLSLARGITAVAETVDCTGCDSWQMAERLADDPDYFRRFDFALILANLRDFPGFPADRLPPHADIPCFGFTGYHPDCCYVAADGEHITDGPVGPYHSMIALAGYKEQIGPAATARFFNDRIYEQAGYYRQWEAQRDETTNYFARFGYDIGGIFRKASRGRSFMHTIDHPDIVLMTEMAKVVLRRFDRPYREEAPAPVDALANVSWPIYPEVGERLGVAGDYRFRPIDRYITLDLNEYLEEAFASFGRWDRSRLRVFRHIQPRLQHIRRLIREGL
jgi:hypothetical protein